MFFLNNKKLKKSFKVTFIMIIFFAITIVPFLQNFCSVDSKNRKTKERD